MSFSLSRWARYFLEADPIERIDGFHEAEGVRVAVAAVGTLLRNAHDDVVNEALLHTLVSVDEPRADRVHLRVKSRGEVRPFRDVVPLLAKCPKQFIGGAIERIETGARWFDVDAKEAFAKVVSIYTIQYSNFMPYAPAVKRHFFTDPPEHQQGFLRAFLDLYDQGTDVTHMKGADKAAEWLRAQRVCRAQQTLVLRDDVLAVDVVAIETELREALAAFADIVTELQRTSLVEFRKSERFRQFSMARLPEENLPTDMQTFARITKEVINGTPKDHSAGLVELLTELKVPTSQIALSALARACVALSDEPMPYDPQPATLAALPTLLAAQERLKAATKNAIERAC